MKKLSILIMVLMVWNAIPTSAQVQQVTRSKGKVYLAAAFRPSAFGESNAVVLKDDAPLYWRFDSTYYSIWNTGTSNWDLYNKNFITYNADNRIIQSLYLSNYPPSTNWVNSYRYAYSYYPSGNREMLTTQTWDTVLNTWNNYYHYHYNVTGNTDTSRTKYYDQVNHRYNSGTQTITTYIGGQSTEELNQILDTATSAWVDNSRSQYTYNGGNKLTEILSQNWDAGLSSWVNTMKMDYSFDGTGYSTGYQRYSWDNIGNTWINEVRVTNTNNSSGDPVSILTENWNSGLNSWVNWAQDTYQYDANGKLTEHQNKFWDPIVLIWVNSSKETQTYHSNGNPDLETSYYWNPLTLAFMDITTIQNDSSYYNILYSSKTIDETTYEYTGGYKYIYTYNTFHNTDQILEQYFNPVSNSWYDNSKRTDSYDANQNLITELDQVYDTLTQVWTNAYRQDHYYTFISGMTEKHGVSEYCYYSNPIDAGKSIVCPNLAAGKNYNISLINIRGQIIYSKNILQGESLTVPSNTASGLYLLQIVSDGKMVASGKVIVK